MEMDPFSYVDLKALVDDCCHFYRDQLEGKDGAFSRERKDLVAWVHRFHEDCGTLTENVKESIEHLKNGPCVFLMTAHQPNLFAYAGVLRKAVLNHVLAGRIASVLKTPVVSFFGVADQDFTDDRWVRCATLPDVERRGGVLELRSGLPEKMMLCKVEKPTEKVLDGWKGEVQDWLKRNLGTVARGPIGINSSSAGKTLSGNLESFWRLVESAYLRAENYSDFTGFVLSKIVNEVWDYPTLFARFSECQQIFRPRFETLLSRFEEYSEAVRNAISSVGRSGNGVCDDEFLAVPFWLHCDCGSKSRLIVERHNDSIAGVGRCLKCEKEYNVDLGSREKADISEIADDISARSIVMPLVFFEGLGVCCYVGGEGGREYLFQAKYVAERMFRRFAVVVVWRPHDIYRGVGQLAASMIFEELSRKRPTSDYDSTLRELKEKVEDVQREIDQLETEKKRTLGDPCLNSEDRVEKLKALSLKQARVRKLADYTVLARRLGLIENVGSVMNSHPCIIDYAVNVGLKTVAQQWIRFLSESNDISADVRLVSELDGVLLDTQAE
jgi:hypothetical protein